MPAACGREHTCIVYGGAAHHYDLEEPDFCLRLVSFSRHPERATLWEHHPSAFSRRCTCFTGLGKRFLVSTAFWALMAYGRTLD